MADTLGELNARLNLTADDFLNVLRLSQRQLQDTARAAALASAQINNLKFGQGITASAAGMTRVFGEIQDRVNRFGLTYGEAAKAVHAFYTTLAGDVNNIESAVTAANQRIAQSVEQITAAARNRDAAVKARDLARTQRGATAAMATLGVADHEGDFRRKADAISFLSKALDQGAISQETFNRNLAAFAKHTRDYEELAKRGFTPPPAPDEDSIRRLGDYGSKLGQLSNAMSAVGNRLTIGVTVPVTAFALASLKASGNIDTAQKSMERFVGGAENAAMVMGQLRKLALESPLDIEGAVEGARRLITLKVATTDAADKMRILNDTTLAVGGDHGTLFRLTKAITDVQQTGKLMGQEVRQFAQNGVAVGELLARVWGTDVDTALKRAKSGAVPLKDLINDIFRGLDMTFGGEGKIRVSTYTGQVELLKDSFKDLQIEVGKQLQPAALWFVKLGQDAVDSARKAVNEWQNVPNAVKVGVAGLVGLGTIAGPGLATAGQVGTVVTNILLITKLIRDQRIATAALAAAQSTAATSAANVAASTFSWVGALKALAFLGIGTGIAAGVIYLGKKMEEFGDKASKEADRLWRVKEDYERRFPERRGQASPFAGHRDANQEHLLSFVRTKTSDFKPGPTEEDIKKAAQAREAMFRAIGVDDMKVKLAELQTNIRAAWDSLSGMQRTQAVNNLAFAMEEARDVGVEISKDLLAEYEKWVRLLPPSQVADIPELMRDAVIAFARLQAVRLGEKSSLMEHKVALNEVVVAQKAALEMAKANREAIKDFKFVDSPTADLGDFLRGITDQERTIRSSLNIPKPLSSIEDMRKAIDMMNEMPESQRMILFSQREIDNAYRNYYRARIENEEKLKGWELDHFKRLEKQKGLVNGLKATWQAWGRQVSTIVNDLAREIAEFIIPRARPEERKDLVPQRIMSDFRQAFEDLSARGFADPKKALEDIIRMIKEAGTTAEANRIALRHFGESGPEIARLIRTGQLSIEQLTHAVDHAADTMEELEDTTRESGRNFMEVVREMGRSVVRSLVETGVNFGVKVLIGSFKDLLGVLGNVLTKIPVIGAALRGIGLGSAAAGAAGAAAAAGGAAVDAASAVSAAELAIGIGSTAATVGGTVAAGSTTAAGAGGAAAAGVGAGLMGTLGAVGAIGSMISSIVGNFQMRGMNKSLDIIVKHTLQTANDLANLRADEWTREDHWFEVEGRHQLAKMTKFDDLMHLHGQNHHSLLVKLDQVKEAFGGSTFTGMMNAMTAPSPPMPNEVMDVEIKRNPILTNEAMETVHNIHGGDTYQITINVDGMSSHNAPGMLEAVKPLVDSLHQIGITRKYRRA